MLSGKQKRYLRGLANRIDQRFQLGKEAPGEGLYGTLKAALEAHELIKVALLQTCPLETKEAGELLAKNTDSELVQTIGRVIVLYRRSTKAPKIVLP